MHLLLALEANKDGHPKFLEWLRTFRFKYKDNDSETKPWVREIRLYNVIIDEEHLPKLLTKLKPYEKLKMNSGRRLDMVQRFLGKFLPLDYVDTSSIVQETEAMDMTETEGPWYVIVVGSLPDMKNHHGVDMK